MKKPNPIFLGVITLVALLPHAPRLLPGYNLEIGGGLTTSRVQAAPLNIQTEHPQEMPTAELPAISVEGSDCTLPGLEENRDLHQDAESAEKLPELQSVDTKQNCDAARNPLPHNFLS